MCEQCEEIERRRAALGRRLEAAEFVAADDRMSALGQALSARAVADAGVDPENDDVPSIGVDGRTVRQSYAIALGVPLADLERVVLVYAGDSVAALMDRGGVDPVAAVEGATIQGLAFGWHLRDEQLKARDVSGQAPCAERAGESLIVQAVDRLNARSAGAMPSVADAAPGEIGYQADEDVARALVGLDINLREFKERVSLPWALSVCQAMGLVEEDVTSLTQEQAARVKIVMGGLAQALALGCVHEQVRAERDRA